MSQLLFAKIGFGTASRRILSKQWSQRYLLNQLGKIPGIPAKLNQFLTTLPAFQEAASAEGPSPPQPEPLPIEDVKAILLQECPHLCEELEFLSPEAITASIGQVHRGILRSGTEIAIKVQYPEVQNVFEQQLEQALDLMSRMGPASKLGLDVPSYRDSFRASFLDEFNYSREARSQTQVRERWKGHPEFIIPWVLEEYSTSRVLVQTYELGSQTASDLSSENGVLASGFFFDFLAENLFKGLEIYSDLHDQNWRFKPETKQLVLYDFGSMLRLDLASVSALLLPFKADHPSKVSYWDYFCSLGFDQNKLGPIQGKVQQLGELIFSQFWEKTTSSTSPRGELGKQIESLLGADKWWFRVSGPPPFFFWMRSLYGYQRLWQRFGFTAPIRERALQFWRDNPQAAASFSSTPAPSPRFAKAEHLKIRICDQGEETVFIEMPATAADRLEELIPEETLSVLPEKGISLSEISLKAAESSFAPQSLFDCQIGQKTYRVWLE